MKMTTRKFHTISLALIIFATGIFAETRTFTDLKGRSITAEIISVDSQKVKVKRNDGRAFSIPIKNLSKSDQEFLAKYKSSKSDAKPELSHEKLNEAFGIKLFEDHNLWDDKASSIAKRLGWPLESKTEEQESYRIYPGANYRVLGAMPRSAVLYGMKEKASRMSLVFANKGDQFDGQNNLAQSIKKEAKTIKDKLKAILGEPTRASFGRGKNMRERVDRWNWGTHAILLSEQDGEYLNLRIMHTQLADTRGMGQRTTDSELRDKLKLNIVKHENGDVLLKNIPMVDQGPKGYCVPATFERYLRYMSLPADMYTLAMAGETTAGGGTYTHVIVQNVERYVSNLGRKLTPIKGDASIRNVARQIDNGLPIMWSLFSSEAFNQVANARTKERKGVNDWNAWKSRCKSDDKKAEALSSQSGGHICMIVGYNSKTKEIAISDSWGPAYELRWITAEQAKAVAKGTLYIIKI